ncbi:hypothetical protein M9H77_12999 [Catharanthus roseus]|uniref:Uncharacterized protein n=1 Tax=Catharanthus roseus TaxID=4058 RepID=A0ACC0BIX0_CATRO|nr:hypothetical protein M9H77_12999 [Catharanthus roseus]
MKWKLGPITSARIKKLKASNRNEDNGTVAYMEEVLKKKFLIGALNLKILNRGSLREGGDPWEEVESKLQSKVDLHQSGFIMSTEGQFPTQSHQEGTSDPTRMNLNETLSFVYSSLLGRSKLPQGKNLSH